MSSHVGRSVSPGSGRVVGGTARDSLLCKPSHTFAQRSLEELICTDRRKDEFLAMAAHELRSPLAAIHYSVRLLAMRAGEASTQHKTHALIERQLRRMTQLVDDLLDVSRITSGRMHLNCERLDLRVIVGNAIETIESALHERKHRLTVELPEAPVWMHADALRLEQVFVNLLTNAVRYTDQAGDLEVCLHTGFGLAAVRVRDSGIGIAPETLLHVFDLFRQADQADDRSRSGLGIGLAVVRRIVELHGGSVAASSAGTGMGSEFLVRLPQES